MRIFQLVLSTVVLLLSHAFINGRGDLIWAGEPYKEIHVQETGTIRGTVRLSGTVPDLEPLPVTKDDPVCGKRKTSPRLVLGKNLVVANTVIYLEGVTSGKKFADIQKVTLNQVKCEYQPHVLLVPPRAQFEIVNSDKVLHNVHAYDIENGMKSIFNIAQPIAGQKTTVKQRPKDGSALTLATCDAGHPWMSAYVVYMDHPYYVVTGTDGGFLLEGVPPGSYKLKMWHEGVSVVRTEVEKGAVKKYYYEEPYESEQEVTVPPSGSVMVAFEFSLR